MNADYRLKPNRLFVLITLLAIGVAGCAANSAYKRGTHASVMKDYDLAMAEFKAALNKDPDNIEYQLKYQQARYNAALTHFEAGRRALEMQDFETAKAEFTRTLEIDPTHELAAQQLARINDILAPKNGKVEPIVPFDELRDLTKTDPSLQSQLDVKVLGPVDLHMTQDYKVTYETLAEFAGLNVIFDPDVRSTRVPIDLSKVNIFEALDILALETRTFWKPVNRTTILVAPDNQTKRRDYEDLILKTIYLSNSVTSTEITEAITALRTLLNMRYLAQSTSMNAIIVRDTADRIAIAEKIIKDLDKPKGEVLVDATVMEVDITTLRQLGILPPQGTAITAIGGSAVTGTGVNGNAFPLNNLPRTSAQYALNIPPATAQFLATSNNAKLIQNPQVRASDGKLASIRIGSQVPIASGSFQPAFVGATGTPVVNFQYIDVGVNLDITPHVLLNREVSMTVQVQVRAVAGSNNVGGVQQPVLTNRQVTHEIRLVEGETNILGGIITDSESTSLNGIPGLKDIPILRYFFSQEQKQRDKTEIIIMLTPHILRMPNIMEANLRGLNTGSESFPRLRLNTSLNGTGGASAVPVPVNPGGVTPVPVPVPPAPAAPAPVPGAPANPPATQPPATPPNAQPPATAPNTQAQALGTTNSTVVFSPSPITLPATGTATVNIVGSGTDFYGVDLTLQFEPGAFNIREIRDGGFLSRDGQIVAFVQRQETENGMVHLSLERPPGAAPISGMGNLVTLVLERGPRRGDSKMSVTEFHVRDPQQNVSNGKSAEVTISVP
jgi:general secretion pathway protein D